ncbi:MAG: V-type ATP synthase subunit I [Candidatus Rifleibacteriota bacterium]
MKKLLLAARNSERERVLDVLKAVEAVHVEPVDPTLIRLPEGLSLEIDNCTRAIALLEQVRPPDNSKLVPPGTPSRVVEEVLSHDRAIPQIREKLSQLRHEIEELTPWGQLGLKDVKCLIENGLKVKLLKGPAEDFSQIVAEAASLIHDDGGIAFVVAASRTEISIPVSYAEIELPSRDVNTIDTEMVNLERQVEEHVEALSCFSLRLDDLRKHYIKLINRKAHSQVATGVHVEDAIFVLTGWCPTDRADELGKAFETEGIAVGLQFSEPAEDEIPPTLLKNSEWANAIAPLYEFMGVTPSYTEMDISGMFLIMLTIFSAFLLADAGYGLLVFIALAAAYMPLVKKGVDKNALKLGMFLFGGVSIYGLLTNTWFGEDFKIIESYRFDPNSPEGMVMLQGICFLMGTIHLSVGHIIKALRRKIDITILSEIGWIMFLWAMYGVICGLILKQDFLMPSSWIIPLFEVSGVLILLFSTASGGIFARIGAGVGAILQNASACFSDIVSYIRLWAVGLAGGKVAMAFNDIAAMLPMFVLKLPVYLLGHTINIILGVIAVLAHGVRLNLLEFSNHLELEWAGRKYDPFKEIR